MITSGSMFSGMGGLDLAVAEVFGAEPVWFADNDPDAARVLAHHWPVVPNLGDVTGINWATVPRPDILTAGFPCQDVSVGGNRIGLIRYGHQQTRSGLWAEVCRAIDILRPGLVVLENVRGLTSARADCDVEFCSWCMGDTDPESVLRALGAVLGDLADCGFDAVWYGLPAAEIGAPHNRFRIFILAWPAAAHPGHGDVAERTWTQRRQDEQWPPERSEPGHHGGAIPTDAAGDARRVDDGDDLRVGGWPQRRGQAAGGGVAALAAGARWRRPGSVDTATAERAGPAAGRPARRGGDGADADTDGGGFGPDQRELPARQPDLVGRAAADADGDGRQGIRGQHPVERNADGRGDADEVGHPAEPATPPAAADAERGGRDGRPHHPERGPGGRDAAAGAGEVDWGIYEPAIRRWEQRLGRPAPPPAARTSRNGGYQLTGEFDEWLMGLPVGHVTHPDIWRGVKRSAARNAQLRLCGNGVVPQQAAEALRRLLPHVLAALHPIG